MKVFGGAQPSLANIIERIKADEFKNVVVLVGAGISVSAGIPDFRSPKTGLYSNLKQYEIPHPQAIFELPFFKRNPNPFFKLARELWPSTPKPTLTHWFLRLLAEKGILRRIYSQNIDTLEIAAGIPDDIAILVHGSFATASCTLCRRPCDIEPIRTCVMEGSIPSCKHPQKGGKGLCTGVPKPDIVFFGENLPHRFFSCVRDDSRLCDLLIVIGTSLEVQPVSSLVSQVRSTCPRVLINLTEVHALPPDDDDAAGDAAAAVSEPTAPPGDAPADAQNDGSGSDDDSSSSSDGGFYSESTAFRWRKKDNYRDVAVLGKCDDAVRYLAEELGWADELRAFSEAGGLKWAMAPPGPCICLLHTSPPRELPPTFHPITRRLTSPLSLQRIFSRSFRPSKRWLHCSNRLVGVISL